MKFIYEHAGLPSQRQLLIDVNVAADRLYNKLSRLDTSSLDISDYNKKYFGSKLKNLIYSLQFSSYLVSWSITGSNFPYDELLFMEYGAGSGITCLLAKELGMKVIYNDIYDVSVRDARIIAKAIGNEADNYLEGDIDKVIDFFKLKKINCNAIVSSDVIEHIYDVPVFLRKIPLLSNGPLSVVLCSGANPFHPYVKRKLMKFQKRIEFHDRQKEYGHKERDTLKAYRSVRKEIIKEYLLRSNIALKENEVLQLVNNTRGMIDVDIRKTIEHYLHTSQIPAPLAHPTNTCDPYTGNWAEHLMNPYELAKILAEYGFTTSVLAGFYGNLASFTKRHIGRILDIIIHSKLIGKHSLRLTPFYTVYGKRN